MPDLDFNYMLKLLPGIIFGLSVHEFAHASMAYKLGDDTAKEMGRFTLNPLKHIDIIGFIFLIIAGFGWAKPVIINKEKLKNPISGDILISLAGPVSNFLLSIFIVILLKVLLMIYPFNGNEIYEWILNMLIAAVYVNIGLFIFNLIPIPPLDGSHVLLNMITLKKEIDVEKFYRYGTSLFFGLIILGSYLKIDLFPIGKASSFIAGLMFNLVGIY